MSFPAPRLSINRYLKCKLEKWASEIVLSFSMRMVQGHLHVKEIVELCVQLSDLSRFGPIKYKGQSFVHSETTHSTLRCAGCRIKVESLHSS